MVVGLRRALPWLPLVAVCGCATATVRFANTFQPVMLGPRDALGEPGPASHLKVGAYSGTTGEEMTRTAESSSHTWASSEALDMEATKLLQGRRDRCIRDVVIDLDIYAAAGGAMGAWATVDGEVVEVIPGEAAPEPAVAPAPEDLGAEVRPEAPAAPAQKAKKRASKPAKRKKKGKRR